MAKDEKENQDQAEEQKPQAELESAEKERPEHKKGREPEEIQLLRSQLEEQKKVYLYLRADFENYKRNMAKERLELTARGEDNVLKQVFGLIALLDRAIKYAHDHKIAQPVIDGLELVKREIHLIFERYKVTKIPTEGEKFDPKIHDAIAVVEANDLEPGTIVKEERPGFMREGRVLEPARVVVVKEPSEQKTVH